MVFFIEPRKKKEGNEGGGGSNDKEGFGMRALVRNVLRASAGESDWPVI